MVIQHSALLTPYFCAVYGHAIANQYVNSAKAMGRAE